MGDFASPAAGPNGSICINNTMNPAAASVVGIPKHSTVVERLRQRIEGCRRHHVTCESRYQQAHAEQLEIDRRETVSLYQRNLEQRAKKSASGSSGTKQPQSKQPDPDSASSTEQRNNTLIAWFSTWPSLCFVPTFLRKRLRVAGLYSFVDTVDEQLLGSFISLTACWSGENAHISTDPSDYNLKAKLASPQ